MNGRLSKKVRQLDEFLMGEAIDDEAMLLTELDGFLAGIVICPDMIMPSEWLPLVWGDDEGPDFESLKQAEEIMALLMGHYNDIIKQLDKNKYAPIYDVDSRNDEILWQSGWTGFIRP